MSPPLKKSKFRETLAQVVCPTLFWLILWQGAAQWVGQELLLPSPFVVMKTFFALVMSTEFWQSMGKTLLRVSVGILIGTVAGSVLAVLSFALRICRFILSPAIRGIQGIPVVSFILLVLLWWRRDMVPVVVSGLMVLPLIWSNTVKGLEETDPKLLAVGKAYGFPVWKRWWLIYLPSAFPYFITALRSAVGLAWKSGVAAEVICQPPLAIGTEMSYSRLYLDTPQLFAWTLVVVVLSIVMERGLGTIGNLIHSPSRKS